MITPRLEILPPAQQRLWGELADTPAEFVLYGGTALALQLGHRCSVDFDFFGARAFAPADLVGRIPYLKGAEIIDQAPSTLHCVVDRGDAVHVSFFGLPNLCMVRQPLSVEGTSLRLAAPEDIAGMKAAVITQRAAARDYVDLDALISAGIDLVTALAAASVIYGDRFHALSSLKALSWLDDIPIEDLPQPARDRLAKAVAGVRIADIAPRAAALKAGA